MKWCVVLLSFSMLFSLLLSDAGHDRVGDWSEVTNILRNISRAVHGLPPPPDPEQFKKDSDAIDSERAEFNKLENELDKAIEELAELKRNFTELIE